MQQYLPFEERIEELDRKLHEAQLAPPGHATHSQKDIEKMRDRLTREIIQTYRGLSPWQKTLVARHPNRPQTLDYAGEICDPFIELHGDRTFGDDPSILGGFAKINGLKCLLVGHEKGHTTRDRVARNFGMSQPEGYRKALRLFRLAERFNRPILTLVDTPGAYPGIQAEERGQAEAIAHNIRAMMDLRVPIVSVVIGEGGSGGALALAVSDRILMLEYSVYSVISPEACVAILWKNGESPERAAQELHLTAQDLLRLGVVDQVIPEPVGGAHRDPAATGRSVRDAVLRYFTELQAIPPDDLLAMRVEKFRKMGDRALGNE